MDLDGPDLFHLTQEAPGRPTHTLKIAVVDGDLDPQDVRQWLADACQRIPVLRWRLDAGRLRPHRWITCEPAIDRHIEHIRAPAPGGEDELVPILADLCARPLDRTVPLWSLHVIAGLGSPVGARTALVLRLHHALADGAASARIWEELSGARSPEPGPEPASQSRVQHLARLIGDVPRLAWRWREHSRRLAAATDRGGVPAVAPFSAPVTPFNEHLQGARSCTFTTLPLNRVKAAGARFDASINEVLLAISAGALRDHIETQVGPLDASLTSTVPAALPDRSGPYGNAVTTLYLSLHSDLEPDERIASIKADLRAARAVLADDPRLLPDSQRRWRFYRVLVWVMRREERRRGRPAYNAIVSSVRGPAPFEICHRPVVELRSVGPLSGRLGLNITAWSYGDDLSIGIHAYRDASDRLAGLGPRLHEALVALEASAPS